ncbi:hypothetical protein GF360_02960 [candidate division WWE3 bacterium]|nr:hypothetical protein [candidate division WWE3 bacterium]
MTQENTNQNRTQNLIVPIGILLFIIIGSLVYFGNFWYQKIKGDSLLQARTALEQQEQLDAQPQVQAAETSKTPSDVKSDKPKVELFVMSHCPYGTQMEKGIIPVVETLGDSIDFELKFVDYVMHGKEEVDEQLAQYCIQENEPEKLLSYLSCFLEDSDSGACLNSVGVDQNTLASCIQASDEEFGITASFEDKSSWKSGRFPVFATHAEENTKYGVRGSPTLIINGANAEARSRDPATLLATVCSYFNEEPEACSTSLSSATPAPGFGTGTASSPSSASCN